MQNLRKFKGYASKVTSTLFTIVQYGCVVNCTLEYLVDFVWCSGPSMEPTIYTNNIIMSEHISPRILHKFKRGDIVIAQSPANPQQNICKRIIGLPGDKIKTVKSLNYVVPNGHVWLEGDNWSNSTDSRTYGPVPQGLIKGRVLCRVWPFKDRKILTDYPEEIIRNKPK